MVKLPTVTLDTTLTELYQRGIPKHAHQHIAQVLCGTNSRLDLSPNFPRNSKYLFQDSFFNKAPHDRSEDDPRRTLAMKYLSLIPQRDAFISGKTSVVLFHLDESTERMAHDKREAELTMAVLAEDQRPDLVFCPGPEKIPVEERGIDLIAYKLMLDGLERYNLLVDPDVHWRLNSKAALAQSGLPTPYSDLVEVQGYGGPAGLCCGACSDSTEGFVIPLTCNGARGRWFEVQSARIREAISGKKLPFVLKNQQTFGGAGTYMIRTEKDRASLVEHLFGDTQGEGILRRLLSAVTDANMHLRPGTIILSELVDDPIGDYGLTFFVMDKEAGEEHLFLAASEQMTDQDDAWIGSTIHYDRQETLKRKFGDLVKEVADWLAGQGYVGPAGIDVLETRSSTAQEDGLDKGGVKRANVFGENQVNGLTGRESLKARFPHFHIVDLNVRTSGSICLPLLRGHFTGRGLMSAASFSISVQGTRDEFLQRFAAEFEAGEMCLLSWYEDPESGFCVADVAVGARDEKELKKAMEQVRDATDEITF